MIRAVIFDYFGVISSDQYWNLVKTDKNLSSDWLNMANRVNLGRLHWRDFIKMVADKTGQSPDEVEAMYSAERIDPRVVAFIKQLKDGYKTGMITNAHHEFLEPIINKTGLKDIFDSIVISSRVGYIKPDKQIFDIALSKLEVKPNEAVFIDDISRNVAGAEQAGIKAIHYRSLEQLKTELSRLLGSSSSALA